MADNNSTQPGPIVVNTNQGSGILNDMSVLIKDMAVNSFDLASGKYRAKSIAERARKSILMYKVGISTSVNDLELASDIAKYLELMYAIFTMINLGYNPAAKTGDEISKVIDSVSAEAFDPTKAINLDVKRSLDIAMRVYEYKKSSYKPRIGRRADVSTEATSQDSWNKQRAADDKHQESLDNHERHRSDLWNNQRAADDKHQESLDRRQKDSLNSYYEEQASTHAFINGLEKKSITGLPTIVTMKTKYADIPLAVKTNLYPLTNEEIKNMIENAVSGKAYKALRYAKWRSGEISTLAWLFNTDIADRDKKLYKSLGKNPWYIDLMKRKAAAKSSAFAKYAVNSGDTFNTKDMYKAVKTDINNLKNFPPTASLILTKNDLVAGTNLNMTHFTKNERLLKTIMKNLYLLCLGIVDPDTEMINFFFDGYTYPFTMNFRDFKRSKDPNETLYDAIRELARRS